jgi:voltage-gated potassium channel
MAITSKSEEAEARKLRRNFRAVAVVAIFVLATGSVFYHIVEKLTWLNSIYFSTITLATVGYGDIVPKTDLGKFFTIFYVIIGIGIIATFANLLLRNAVARRELRHYDKANNLDKNDTSK